MFGNRYNCCDKISWTGYHNHYIAAEDEVGHNVVVGAVDRGQHQCCRVEDRTGDSSPKDRKAVDTPL